ncbi:Clathrin light chain A [Hondaea fermentalgiana]|uniref:Clathrin light chain n=1 Tax=Hondaea fermentalgiana TaxID=2315210 RepID=A0A2R5G7Q9_9STRA|nr:Clathrin light chain A [Hondaea fermentalgiana]|eukprot:GBG27067.1 Clathrin light chain A [Hondaea fermentalgiana]
MAEEDPFGFTEESNEEMQHVDEFQDPFQESEDGQPPIDAFGETDDVDGQDAFEESEDAEGGYADLGGDDAFAESDGADMMDNNEAQQQQQQQQPQQPQQPQQMPAQPHESSMDAEDPDADDAALRAFQRKWEAELSEKDAKMETQRSEMKERAQQELEKFKAEKADALKSRQKTNREQEEHFLEDINEALTAENPWERILSLVDISKSSGAKGEGGERDLARLRKIFVQLKNDPPAQ